MAWFRLHQRLAFAAALRSIQATCSKPAAGFGVNGRRNLPLHGDAFNFLMNITGWDCRKQRLRIWVQRALENRLCLGRFHQLTQIHNADMV